MIHIQVAVPQARDGQVDELRNQFVGGSPDGLAAIEVAQVRERSLASADPFWPA